ncbi:type VI secretion protein IcmF/TssM N-terminal domain-containing protein [Castellaniella sp.]|uniref:type VI secretion protein IcmF/TssM N-terminal domain-containing protein n=1 Tax=Castellaniella sp. TaxID=1955812 RepID=UPI002AFF169D|nr:type VI secretion protein IcmF/TssM N-terminal domain-containing protein [Castellaniella sp.]
MKTFLLRFLQLIALALFSWILAMYLMWPAWGALAVFFGCIGIWLSYKLLRRLWLVTRSRAKLAASEIHGRSQNDTPAGLTRLNQKWKQTIASLRRSSLRRHGNPIYALPWYMVIGQPGSGKTTAITQSRPGSLVRGTAPQDIIEPTENCEWWFLNRAVILDTAGRYVAADNTETDQAEWNRILELLSKYRLKEGINGLVLCVTADQLIQASEDTLASQGQALREHINQLIRLFDRRFPIHLLITQCDHIPGFEAWSKVLSTSQLSQAMGFTGALADGDGAEARFADQAIDQITARLRQLRLDTAVQGLDLSPELLLFPDEIERLRAGLKQFLAASMGNSPYLEQPLLRGIFLTSAHQDGQHWPDILDQKTGNTRPVPVRKGLFLHDVFEYVLPADRSAWQPTIIVDRWRQATRNLATLTWLCLCLAALGFLLVSYYQTRTSLLQIRDAYPKTSLNKDQPAQERIQALRGMLSIINLIDDHEQQWATRWLAFSPDLIGLENDIKSNYVDGYRELLERNRREVIIPALQQDDPAHEQAYSAAILTLTRNINQTQARIQGADYEQLLKMPQAPEQITATLGLDLPSSLDGAPAQMAAAFKAWSPTNAPWLEDTATSDRTLLQQAIDQTDHFPWLLSWANHQSGLSPVALRDFWLPGSQGTNHNEIPPAMTLVGYQRIEKQLDEIGQALNQSTDFQFKKGAFEAWYASERLNTWRSFAWSFDQGEQLITNEPAWRDLVTRVDTVTSPYYLFFDRLNAEFAGTPDTELPGWLQFSREFSTQRRVSSDNISLDKASAIIQTINTIGTRILHPEIKGHVTAAAGTTLNRSIQGVQAFSDYAKQFDVAAAKALEGTGQAYQLSADYFSLGTDPKAASSDLQTAQDSLNAFRKASGYNQPDDQMVWKLVGGPLRILTQYALEQASCHIQQAWEHDVLWKTQLAVSSREANDQLFGDQGSVWAFADGPLKPFVQRQASGFSLLVKDSYKAPLNGDFLPFLNRSVNTRVESVVKTKQAEAVKGKSANILITARPLGVNEGAKAQPYAAILSIQCSQQEVTLDNFNMAVTNSFDWSPEQCGDVTLRIDIDDLTLTQRYPGPMGMARFLTDFKDGEHIFTPADFPQSQARLDALDVRTIHVRYDFTGADQLLAMADQLSYLAETDTPAAGVGVTPARVALKIPDRVGQCWTAGPPRQTASTLPLYIQQRADLLLNPTPEPDPVQAPEPPPPPPPKPAPPERTHKVLVGDTLYSLARHYGTTIEALQKLNHIKNDNLILIGRTLKIPPTESNPT